MALTPCHWADGAVVGRVAAGAGAGCDCVADGVETAVRGVRGAQAAHLPPCLPQLAQVLQVAQLPQEPQFPDEHAAAPLETTTATAMIHNPRM